MSSKNTLVLGIRHHGPGSARSLRDALERFDPEVVLVEGPPDADPVLRFVGAPDLRPPVALLVHDAKEPRRAAFFPFARFSPEWVALAWAGARGRPARFCDLPIRHQLGLRDHGEVGTPAPDPLGALAQAAGDLDGERWWSRVVEEARSEAAAFEAIAEAMVELRRSLPAATGAHARREALREAFMRKTLRSAERGGTRVAVVVGAWHVPALLERPKASEDAKLLAGLPRTKVSATWVPWTHSRLSLASGYGAGVEAPGWYDHLFSHPAAGVTQAWLARTARVLRSAGYDAPPASVIDASRLAEALAALRGAPAPGLEELEEATVSAVLSGRSGPYAVVEDNLVVGDAIGAVPEAVPEVPLAADVRRLAKSARLKPETSARELVLDLREPSARAKSQLLRRLRILDVPWGQGGERLGGRGAFKEGWRLHWSPELAVRVVDAASWGNTVEEASQAKMLEMLHAEARLPELSRLLEQAVLAEVPRVLPEAIRRLESVAARAEDLAQLADTIPRLARILRYGDAREVDEVALRSMVGALGARFSAGLGGIAAGLGLNAEQVLLQRMGMVQDAVVALAEPDLLDGWSSALVRLVGQPSAAPGCRGRAARYALDIEGADRNRVEGWLARALARGADPSESARWLDGFIAGSVLLLLHDPRLLEILDRWMVGLEEPAFVSVLPILRRAFAELPGPERARLAARLTGRDDAEAETLDADWANRGVRAVARWLGRPDPAK